MRNRDIMFNLFAAVFLIVLNVFILPVHPFPGHKEKKKEPAVSYTIVTKHEHSPHPAGHEHYQGYPDLHDMNHKHHEKHTTKSHKDHNGIAKYSYSYGVKDPKTGDIKKQWESRDGDKVKGGYSFKEADGTTRLVHYTADKDKGFEAVVKKIGKAKKRKQRKKKKGHNKQHKRNADSFRINAGQKKKGHHKQHKRSADSFRINAGH